MTRRYPGAQPFSIGQKPIFFGREQELDELHRFMLAEQLVVLYAKSGLGKSSLLNAGLIPLVEEEGRLQPLSIRFGAYTEGSKATPLGNAVAGIREGISGADEDLEKIKPAGEDSLWYHLKTRQLATAGRGYLLVFDQFEELFTYPEEAVQAFGKQLSELLYTTIPDRFRQQLRAGVKANAAFLSEPGMQRLHSPFELRVIMAIRSDRMSLMNKLKAFLPNILENCYELRSLTIQEAESAILSPAYLPRERGPFESPVFDYEDEAVASLIDFLSEGRTQEIESFQLQILCEHAERQVVLKQGKTLVTRADVANPDLILENYYLGKIEDLPESDRLPARRLIEEGLVFEEEERRLTLYEGQITRTYGIGPALLRTLLDTHLIRSEPSLRGGYTYELSHDTLVAPVLKAKNKRLEAERLEAEREALRRKEAEMAELREKAEKERQLREKAEVNEQRARQRTRLAAGISIVALVLALFAGWSFLQANAAREEANISAAEALRQKGEAESAKMIADENFRKAKEEEAKTNAALEQVTKEQAATDEQRRKALQNLLVAQQKTKEAESERKKAVDALLEAKAKSILVVKSLLKDAHNDIFHLRYPGALQKLKDAVAIGEEKIDVARALLEIAFFYEESNHADLAKAPLELANGLLQLPIGQNFGQTLANSLLAGLKKTFLERYYPVMVEVKGGEASIDFDNKKALVNSFEIGQTETTFWQYALYASAIGKDILSFSPSWGLDGNNPVVNVSWFDAVLYANWLSEKRGFTPVYTIDSIGKKGQYEWDVDIDSLAKGFRLPSEIEWEYAARGGFRQDTFLYSGTTDNLGAYAWFDDNSDTLGIQRTHPVSTRRANGLGLFDMSGNVWEWCEDWHGEYPGSFPEKYRGPTSGGYRVIRGGSWYDVAELCRVSNRNDNYPNLRFSNYGFRLSRAL